MLLADRQDIVGGRLKAFKRELDTQPHVFHANGGSCSSKVFLQHVPDAKSNASPPLTSCCFFLSVDLLKRLTHDARHYMRPVSVNIKIADFGNAKQPSQRSASCSKQCSSVNREGRLDLVDI